MTRSDQSTTFPTTAGGWKLTTGRRSDWAEESANSVMIYGVLIASQMYWWMLSACKQK